MFLCVFWFRVLYITSFSIQISLQFTPIQYNPIKYNGQSLSLSLDYCVGVGVRLSYIRFIIMESEMMTIIFRKNEKNTHRILSSNLRPLPYQANALTTVLPMHICLITYANYSKRYISIHYQFS